MAMDPVSSRAQRQMAASSSKSKSSKSTTKKSKKKKRATKSQNAGQPSGPAVSTSERSRSRTAVADEGESGARRSETGGSDVGKSAAAYAVGAMHGIDMGLGLALIIYGATVHVASITGWSIFYGLVLLLGAVAGAIGYYVGACNVRGIMVSAVAGFLTCLLDIVAFIAILVGWNSFIAFLNDNLEALMLTEDSVKTIDGLKFLFVIIFIVLGVLEMYRGYAMWKMKDTMSDGRVAPLSRSGSDSKCSWCPSWLGFSKRKKTDDFVMFDDNASMESSLLWSKNGSQPTSDDYLEFVPEHERGLENFHSKVSLPTPPEDRVDY